MRILPALFLTLALPAQAETLSQELGRSGLAATETRLAALATPTVADRFALGGVQFLRAVEGSFQERWALGMTDRTGLLPLLRLPIADNPNPAAFDPAAIVTLFAHAEVRLVAAQKTLTAIPDTADFALEIALDDIWFDINSNGTRNPGEGIGAILGAAVGAETGDGTALPLPVIRFDVADAAWTAAYANLLAGFCNLIRAYDPTEPLTRVLAARATMAALGPVTDDPILGGRGAPDAIDLIATALATLNQTPDSAMMTAAQAHFLAMVAQNRQFWSRVALESDNDREWLPNDQQTSALGITVPPGTGVAWLAVLDDLAAVLRGETLVPYWRVGAPAGLNVSRMFSDPRPVDLAGWVQGWAALPYLETGRLLDRQSLDAFDMLTSGQAPLFALYLN